MKNCILLVSALCASLGYAQQTFDGPFSQRIKTTSTNTAVASGEVSTESLEDTANDQSVLLHQFDGLESSSALFPSNVLLDIRAKSRAVLGSVLGPPTQLRNRIVELQLQFNVVLAGRYGWSLSGTRQADASSNRSSIHWSIAGAGQTITESQVEITQYNTTGAAEFGTGLVTLTAVVDAGTIDFLWETKELNLTGSFNYQPVPEPMSLAVLAAGVALMRRRRPVS